MSRVGTSKAQMSQWNFVVSRTEKKTSEKTMV